MPKVKRLSGTLFVITALAALPFGSAGTALAGQTPAAKTWTVKPGGTFSGKSTGALKITDTTLGGSVSCKPAAIGGTLKTGSGLQAGIGTVTSSTVNWSNCTFGAGLNAFTRTDAALNWSLTAVGYNATTGMTSGTLGHIHVAASSGGCSFVLDGTGASADNGTLKITYKNGTHLLKILPNTGNLHLYNPSSGCGGILHNNDAISMTVTYALTPAQTITSP
jgi:hypothetical protein